MGESALFSEESLWVSLTGESVGPEALEQNPVHLTLL